MADVTYDGSARDFWRYFKNEEPTAAFVAGVTPGVQVGPALLDMADAAQDQDAAAYAAASLGLLPGGRIARRGLQMVDDGLDAGKRALDYAGQWIGSRRFDPAYFKELYYGGRASENAGRTAVGLGAAAEGGNVASGISDMTAAPGSWANHFKAAIEELLTRK